MQTVLTVKVSDKLKETLEKEARKEYRTLSAFVRHAIHFYMLKEKNIDILELDENGDE